MPTRVFLPSSTNKNSPRSSREASKANSRETTPRQDANTEASNLKFSLEKGNATRLDASTEQTGVKKSAKVGSIKPSSLRRTASSKIFASKEIRAISPRTSAHVAVIAQAAVQHRSEQVNSRNGKHDLLQPIGFRAISSSQTRDSPVLADKVDPGAAALLADRKDEMVANEMMRHFTHNLNNTRERLFYIEPPREKELFHWVDHVAPMEKMEPVAVNTYFSLGRAARWKEKHLEHCEVQTRVYGHATDDAEVSDLFDEEKNAAVFSDLTIRTSTLPPGRNVYEETIPSVFDPQHYKRAALG
jgi:hypothetical protein